jgi:hypothetical protein
MAIGTVTQTQTTAFFLGERFGALESRYTALRVLDEDDEFLIRGVTGSPRPNDSWNAVTR